MIGKTIAHYKILQKLGEGGMGVVYKAEDTKLDRIVALKFLPTHVQTSEVEKARFLQEAKAASAVNHANVCTIYDIQEYDRQLFIVMEYVEGQTLKEAISRGPLAINKAIDLAIQIADGLQEAHDKGIIHRDIKSENIMVNARNQIKIMDFGLAKIKGSIKLTKTSSTVGTLAYMAPEQIQETTVDARSDIFSFGVVLYEMLSAHLPFHGEYDAAMIYSIVNEEADPLIRFLPDVPSALLHILGRALEKNPEARYQNVSDILIELRRMKSDSSKGDSPVSIITKPRNAAKIRVLLYLTVLMVVIICAIAYLFIFHPKSTVSVRTLAVIPFHNLSYQAIETDQIWSLGMVDAIINRLTPIRNLAVRPTSAVLKYAKEPADPEQIARTLAVESVLEGTYQRLGNVIRVSVQLVDCKTRSSRWSSHYDLQAEDMLKFQDDVAQQVVQGLSVQLSSSEKNDLALPMTYSQPAYSLYLEALSYKFNSGPTQMENLRRGERLLKEALIIDPNFANAYVSLAGIYANFYFSELSSAAIDHSEKIELARDAVEHALQLNPRLADAYAIRGAIYWTKGQPVESIENLRKAIEMAPSLSYAWYIMGHQYHWCGLLEKALECLQRAADIDRTNVTARWWHAQILFYLGKEVEAENELNRFVSEYPDNIMIKSYLGEVLFFRGKLKEAELLLRNAAETWWPVGSPNPGWYDPAYFAAYFYISQGRKEKIDPRLFKLKPSDVNDGNLSYQMAALYALLYEKQVSLEWLRRAVALGYHNYPWYVRDKKFNFLRGDDEFQQILLIVRGHWEKYKVLFDS